VAFTRVQGTAKTSAFSDTLNITMGSTPTVGNAIIIPVLTPAGAGYSSARATDNQGSYKNNYVVVSPGTKTAIIFCPYVYVASGTFTITVSGLPFTTNISNALEVSGGGAAGILPNQTVQNSGTSTTPNTGTTAALTDNNIFAVVSHGIAAGQASIAVAAGWTEEIEDLSNGGESDYQIFTTASGSTISCSWTDASSASWSALLVAFAPAGTAGGGGGEFSAAYVS
jgi:hypothetical protein